jgi:hypothetical protein
MAPPPRWDTGFEEQRRTWRGSRETPSTSRSPVQLLRELRRSGREPTETARAH